MYEICSLKTTPLPCKKQSVEIVQYWPWTLDHKMYTRYFPLTILYLCMKSVRWKLPELSCQNKSIAAQLKPWPLDPMLSYLPCTILHLCMKSVHWFWHDMKTTQVIMSEPKYWQRAVETLTFWPKNYRYLPLTILHLLVCMKHERYTVKTTQLSCPNQCWKSSVLTSKCPGIFLSPSCIYEILKLYVEN